LCELCRIVPGIDWIILYQIYGIQRTIGEAKLAMFVLDVRYIPLFRNKNSSKATGVEIGAKNFALFDPYKN